VRRLLLVAALLVAFVPAAAAEPPAMYVVFRPDHTFFVYLASGQTVGTTNGAASVIPAGTYKLLLDDTAEANSQFDLSGPGVKLVTDMSQAEEVSSAYVETFLPTSTYTYRDDNRPSLVWTFTTSAETVTSTGTTTTPTHSSGGVSTSTDVVGSAILPYRGVLAAAVAASGKVTLTRKGKPVTSLVTGRYAVVVADASSRHGFLLRRLHGKAVALTGPAFTGRDTVQVNLQPGRWFYFSKAAGPETFVVASKGG
jgi:hypothetical protein